jgi:hypothetical protein
MIRTIGKLGCTPGGNCCADCASHHLGDTPSTNSASWWIALMIFGGFGLAYIASGKAGRR